MAVDRPRLTYQDALWLLVFAACWFFVAMNHELSHDESQAWNIARESQAWWDVVWNSRYEGHTPVWFGLLWPFSLSGNPVFMQALAVSLGLWAAYLLLRYRSIPRWLCLMVLAGYFIGYEYTIMPRPYIVATLLSVWLGVMLLQNKLGFLGRALICGLIASTSAFGIVLSVPFILLVIVEEMISDKRPVMRIGGWLSGLGTYGALVLTAVYFVVWPIEDRFYEVTVLSGGRISLIQWWQTVRSAVFPHVDRLPLGIGEQVMTSSTLSMLTIGCSLVVVLCVAIWVSDKPAALLSWIVAVILLSVAAIISGSGAERHLGHLYIAAVVLVWARPGLSTIHLPDWCKNGGLFPQYASVMQVRRISAGVLVLAVCYQTAIGMGAAGMDLARGLTQWPMIAQKVRQESVGDTIVMTDHAYHSGPLSALLDKPLFDLRCQCWTRYELWQGSQIPESLPDYRDMLLARSCEMLRTHDQVLFMRVMREWPEDAPLELVAEFASGYRDSRYSAPRLYRFNSERNSCGEGPSVENHTN